MRVIPKGEYLADIPLGATLTAVYYCPYFDAYFVNAPTGRGWVLAKAVKELHFEEVNKTMIALKDTPLQIACLLENPVGYVAEGEEVKEDVIYKGILLAKKENQRIIKALEEFKASFVAA